MKCACLFLCLLLMILLLVACTKAEPAVSPLSPLSPIELPTSTAVPATTTPLPFPATATAAPTTTPFPTALPPVSPVPTLAPEALAPEALAAMAVWQEVESGTGYTLYRISETPLGVVSLEWSPDGRHLWLNVAAGPGGMNNIAPTVSLVVNLNTHQGWAASDIGDSFCFGAHDWSPDGKQLAYIRDRQLWLADVDAGGSRSLALPGGARVAGPARFSPDGQMIAVPAGHTVAGAYQYDVWVLNVVSGDAELLVEDSGQPLIAWSPSGSVLAFRAGARASAEYPTGAARLWIAHVSGERPLYVDLGTLPGVEGCERPPTWVMGGQQVLATILLTPGVWLVDLEGNVDRLDERFQSGRMRRRPGLAAPLQGGRCDDAVASRDGRYVVYTVGGAEMHVIDLSTGTDVVLGPGDLCHGLSAVTWAPHNPQFLLWGQGLSLYLVDATDGTRQQLAENGLWPAWSPDDRQIVYWQAEAGGYALWLLDLGDRQPMRLTSPSLDAPYQWWTRVPYRYDIEPHWSPDGNMIAFVSLREDWPEAYLLRLR